MQRLYSRFQKFFDDIRYEKWIMFSIHSTYVSSNYRLIVFFFFEFFWRLSIHLLTVYIFQYRSRDKIFSIYVKNNGFPCHCRGAQKNVVTVELQVTYDASVRKANIRLAHEIRRREVRFLRATSDNPSLNKTVCDT